jgi:arsenate reductase|tara:strand:+ start:151 stop:504 length:354 start_codon:yes stop_codon:yes gene_type:complete
MSNFIIYHNPRCSKSRQTLALLVEKGYEPEIFLYLEEELSSNMLEEVILKLNIKPRDLLRKGEEEYKKNNLSNNALSNEDLINYMVMHPKLIERPIVIKEKKAILGRPPENIFNLID